MLLTILLSAALVGIDQLLKYLAVQYLRQVGRVPLLPGLIELYYQENTGAAFSILAGRRIFLIIVTSVALLFVLWLLLFRRPKRRLEYLSLLLVFAGGVGNLIDRIANGYVVDYLAFQFTNFAVFNFADILVTTGVGLLVLAIILSAVRERRQGKAKIAAGSGEGAGPAQESALPAEKMPAETTAGTDAPASPGKEKRGQATLNAPETAAQMPETPGGEAEEHHHGTD